QSPVPFDDFYSTPSNTPLTIPAATGVLANDVDPNSPPQTFTVVNAGTTHQFDQVTVNADGSFTFTPAPGFQGQTTFLYTVQNSITGRVNPTNGVMTLTGSSSVSNYQTALRSITFSNTANNASTAVRTITYRADDGSSSGGLSNLATRSVTVFPVHFTLTVPA